MSAKRNVRDRNTASNVVRLFMWCALLAGTVNGQVQGSPGTQARPVDKAKVSDALAKVKTGTQSIRDLEQIALAGAAEAIPDLQRQFTQSQDPDNKAKIAQVLVRFKHSDESYWTSLVQYVTPAIESDTPCPMSFDTKGEAKNGLSPEFTAWVESHKLSPEDALEEALSIFPGKVSVLGATGDPRAIPLLRQALLSPNYFIEVAATRGLIHIQDKDSIALITAAIRIAPAAVARTMAQPLAYVDDPLAQQTVDKYVPPESAKALRAAKADGRTPLY